MLISSCQLLNKGQGCNFRLSRYRLGIGFVCICRDLIPCQSMLDGKYFDKFDQLGHPDRILGKFRQLSWGKSFAGFYKILAKIEN